MRHQRQLGNTGRYVTAIGLGAMPLSLEGRPSEAIAMQVITAFIEGGGNFIDTANVYCKEDNDVGHNELLIQKTLIKLGQLENITVTTKGGLKRPKGSWTTDASPEWLRQSCEKSLKDLNTDCIFLYQLHAPDPVMPLADSVGELARLKEEGKINHIGLSNVNVHEIETALTITSVMSVQNRCNLFEKKSFKNNVVDKCKKENITFIAHSPVGGHFGHAQAAASKQLNQVANKYAASPYQIMLAWLLHQDNHILPIPGASKVSSITDSLKSIDITLDMEDLDLLSNIEIK